MNVDLEVLEILDKLTKFRNMLVYFSTPYDPAAKIIKSDVQIFRYLTTVSKIGPSKISLMISGTGGDLLASYKIGQIIQEKFSCVETYLIEDIASAHTMIALSGQIIYFDNGYSIGPIDPIVKFNLPGEENILRAYAAKDILKEMEILGNKIFDEEYKYKRIIDEIGMMQFIEIISSVNLAYVLAANLLFKNYDSISSGKIARSLISDFPAHDYPISRLEASNIGINVGAKKHPKEENVKDLISELTLSVSLSGQKMLSLAFLNQRFVIKTLTLDKSINYLFIER